MSEEVVISVSGSHELRLAAERATVHATVATDGSSRAPVVEHALTLASAVRTGIQTLETAGSVLQWTSKQLSVRADRPWNHEGNQLAPVFYASVEFTVTFADLAELSTWTTDLSTHEGVNVGHIDWHLSPATATSTERKVAAEAVRVAVTRATAYAEALGLHEVVPLEIADAGLLSRRDAQPQGKGAPRVERMMAMSAPAMEFQADDIIVSATVEARFRAN